MRKFLCAVGALSLLASAASAAPDWGFISTAGDPDPVTAFDIANPGASNMGIGFVDGNFNRGMDFDSPNSFYYYVSTDSLNDPGDRGLWYWNNNVNSQLGTIPFNDAGDGDATLTNDGTRFFVTTDDGDATTGDSLYVFENLNGAATFTEIGETGLTQLIGLAMSPSGVLYGYDSSTESLYTIDASSGAPSLVGASGVSMAAIGGMDFNADGSTLLIAEAGNLYKLSTIDGSATPSGDVVLNTSALSFRVPEPGSLALLTLAGLFGLRRR